MAYTNPDIVWCLDSGCSSHLGKNEDDFSDLQQMRSQKLRMANESSTEIIARGSVHIRVNSGQKEKSVELVDALFVPDLRTNLMSVGKITDKGHRVIFEKECASIVDKNGDVLLVADRIDGLYYIQAKRCIANSVANKATISNEELLNLWHRRMGHLNIKDLVTATQKETIRGIDMNKSVEGVSCDVCIQGKMSRASFP